MKFAIPSDDGVTIARNAGRAGGFIVYDKMDRGWERLDYRLLSPMLISKRESELKAGGERDDSQVDYRPTLDLITDCQAVIVIGMSPRFMLEVIRKGIEAVFCMESDADDTAAQFAEGTLSILDPGQIERSTRALRMGMSPERAPHRKVREEETGGRFSPW